MSRKQMESQRQDLVTNRTLFEIDKRLGLKKRSHRMNFPGKLTTTSSTPHGQSPPARYRRRSSPIETVTHRPNRRRNLHAKCARVQCLTDQENKNWSAGYLENTKTRQHSDFRHSSVRAERAQRRGEASFNPSSPQAAERIDGVII
jgi:hypothetical protein